MKIRSLPLAGGIVSALFGSGLALAQEGAPAATQGGEEKATELAEVVVTSQKRSERLLDVPMSVTAISGDTLTYSGITSTLELTQATPGLITVNNGLGFVPVIRGVSSQGTSPGDESNVAIYLDDVYLGTPLAGFFDLADIERVEVLKGPQGTLFGRNATGGAIRIVTRRPQFTRQGTFSADYGFEYQQWRLGAYLTGPMSESVAASISASYHHGDGHIKGIGPNLGRTYGAPDNHVVRGKLLFAPNEDFEAVFAADTARSQNDIVFSVTPPEGVNPFPGSIANAPFQYAGSTQPMALVKTHSASFDATWNASAAWSLRSITAYRKLDGEYQSDLDRTSQPVNALMLGQYQESLSQEFNFASAADQAVSWLAGLYYYDSEAGNPYWTVVVGADAPGGAPYSSFTNEVRTRSWAGFGDLTWNLSDQWHATLGARYTSETKEFDYRDLVVPGGAAPTIFSRKKTWDSPTWRAILRYDISDDANLYASLSNGFKSGVYDAYAKHGIPVDPEEVTALEVGAKARVNGITLTAAAFAYDYEDIQVQSFVTLNDVIVLSLTNAASAKMRGLEFSADGPLTEHLSFNLGLNWMPTAEYEDFTGASVTVPIPGAAGPVLGQTIAPYDASGSRITRTPDWTGNLRLTYAAPLWEGGFAATLSASYNSGFYWQAGDLTEEDAYETVNLRFSWTDPDGRLTYSLWGTNLTDQVYSTYTVPNVRGDSYTYPAGRQFGVGVGFDF